MVVYVLVLLIFLAKISFKFLGILPSTIEPIIFQYGLHPYVNAAGTVLLAIPAIWMWWQHRDQVYQQSTLYRYLIIGLTSCLTIQTILQIVFIPDVNENWIMALAALFTSCLTIFLFGVVIPTATSTEQLFEQVRKTTVFLCVISVVLSPVFGGDFYKGGRFIGVFKHIPHMVTCATVASIFQFQHFLAVKESMNRIFQFGLFLICLVGIYLTGTRSSLGAVLICFFLLSVLKKTDSWKGQYIKSFFLMLTVASVVLLGPPAYDYAVGIATGTEALGDREAQDGVASRLEEVERGWEIFMSSPWLGQGLISKFSSSDGEASVEKYNSFKDPHNIFVSAGVTGGWPFLFLMTFGLFIWISMGLRAFGSPNEALKTWAVYLVSHIPILIIYHVHLSIGGMADRIYWLSFGLVALKAANEYSDEKVVGPSDEASADSITSGSADHEGT